MSKIKNVVMIMTDSWQFNYTGCYGNDWIRTPNVDALAREGTVFENAYAEGLPTIPGEEIPGHRPLHPAFCRLGEPVAAGNVPGRHLLSESYSIRPHRRLPHASFGKIYLQPRIRLCAFHSRPGRRSFLRQ